MGYVHYKGHHVNKLPLFINGCNTCEKVTYIGDLPYEHLEIVTDKTFYYNFNLEYYIIYELKDRIEVIKLHKD